MQDGGDPLSWKSWNRRISSDFDEVSYTNADFQLRDSHVTEYEHF